MGLDKRQLRIFPSKLPPETPTAPGWVFASRIRFLNSVKVMNHPMVLLNLDGYFDPVVQMIDRYREQQYVQSECHEDPHGLRYSRIQLVVVDSVDGLMRWLGER